MSTQITDIIISGPFWSAKGKALQIENGNKSLPALRKVFIDHPALVPAPEGKIPIEGTAIVSCTITAVTGALPGASEPFEFKPLENTNSLLLLRSEGEAKWKGRGKKLPAFRCLNGYIALEADDSLLQYLQLESTAPEERTGNAELPGLLSAHSSGLSVFGKTALPWEAKDKTLSASFLVSEVQEGATTTYRLTIETGRLTQEEKRAWANSWKRLQAMLNPRHPLNSSDSGPQWASLELSGLDEVPDVYWQLENDKDQLLFFHQGSIRLFLTDRALYQEDDTAPTSIAEVVPGNIRIMKDGAHIKLMMGSDQESDEAIRYEAVKGGPWTETYQLAAAEGNDEQFKPLKLAFNPIPAARQLRSTLGLPAPETNTSDDGALQPAILWGFMPLDDGWGQLPFFNLSEQVYLDNGLANEDFITQQPAARNFRGGVIYGNEEKTRQSEAPGTEHPWEVSIIDCSDVEGIWTIDSSGELSGIQLILHEPEIAINGFMWLGSGRPAIEDAIPNQDNWVSGLFPLAIRSFREEKTLFPSPFLFVLESLTVSAQVDPSGQVEAQLGRWSFQYQPRADFVEQMETAKLIPSNILKDHSPYAWMRHPALPMVQALPMTQSRRPANYPAASRQLIPFELPETNWAFESEDNGAAAWPTLKPTEGLKVAIDWATHPDLQLVALSLPGLSLGPTSQALEPDGGSLPSTFSLLEMKYRLDLPYSDELHALAQLPKKPQDPNIISPLPGAPPPEPPRPLSRTSFGEHWDDLSTLASLASLDAVEAFTKANGDVVQLKNLVEPLEWEATLELNLEAYPGNIGLLSTSDSWPEKINLEKRSALKGISGNFSKDGHTYQVVAHAMAAQKEHLPSDHAQESLRDQRGLHRSTTQRAGLLLQSAVELEGSRGIFLMTTLLENKEIPTGGLSWRLWFKGLPMQKSGSISAFERIRSDEVQDINDPEALSREQNYLQAYEWRISNAGNSAIDKLDFLGLHFYPLTLEQVQLDGGELQLVVVKGRLQLPLSEEKEQEHLSNVVQLAFDLKNDTITLDTAGGLVDWPLDVSAGPAGEVPRLCFTQAIVEAGRLKIADPVVKFLLFDAEWQLPLEALTVQDGEEALWNTPENPADAGINLKMAKLHLGLAARNYEFFTHFAVRLGNTARLAWEGEVAFQISPGTEELTPTQLAGTLLQDLSTQNLRSIYHRRSLQFQWDTLTSNSQQNLQVLPGWQLSRSENDAMPGFATLTFKIEAQNNALPQLTLTSAFVELLLVCRWGQFLLDNPSGHTEEERFASSAGDLTFGATIQYDGQGWQESYLANGLLEIRNLISWPLELRLDGQQLNGPSLAGAKAGGFEHLRHSMRVLLNQHNLPASLLQEQPSGSQLFALEPGQSWQFLAVTEHQLLKVERSATSEVARWAGTQEVRLVTPLRFRSFVEYLAGRPLTDAHLAEGESPDPVTLEELPDTITITGRLINEVGRGIPGQRIELWRDEPPVFSFFQKVTTDDGGHFEFTFPKGQVEVNQGDGFLDLSFFVGSPNTELLKQKWTVRMAGQYIVLVVKQNVPPIQLFGEDFSKELARALLDVEMEESLTGSVLLVEASVPQWIRTEPAGRAGFANLQAMPSGQQTAILSSIQDYSLSPPSSPEWQLFTVPFLGRLQTDGNQPSNAFGLDPVQYLNGQAQASPLHLGFANLSESTITLDIVEMDQAEHIRWPRLDPNRIEESWFRMLSLPDEAPPDFLPSISASLPDTPSRLSRAAALSQAFRGGRLQYPPVLDERILPEYGRTGRIIWREDSLIQFDFASDPEKEATSGHPWLLFALQWQAMASNEATNGATQRYAAATILPTPLSEHLSQALALSPYLDFSFLPAPADRSNLKLEVLSAELLCLDLETGRLLPAASRLLERASFEEEGNSNSDHAEDNMRKFINSWAKAIHKERCPESPIALLRMRGICRNESGAEGEAPLVLDYQFEAVLPDPGVDIARRAFNLRTKVAQLHFREGQFNGFRLPFNNGGEAIHDFELAPPQVAGVQPLYLDYDEAGAAAESGDAQKLANSLPWGLSSLRISTRLSDKGRAIIGPVGTSTPSLLWWQGLQQLAQFRSASSGKASAGLPALFRAKPIRSLAPALPDIPMPGIPNMHGEAWQAVLPSEMRLLPVGARAGAYFAYRYQLMRHTEQETLISESLPVQHRFPRPVSLPPNKPENKGKALQNWASFFEPGKLLHSSASPLDESFFASGGAFGNRRLKLDIAAPAFGAITNDWNGSVTLNILSDARSGTVIPHWKISLEILISGKVFRYKPHPAILNGQQEWIAELLLTASQLEDWEKAVSSLSAGAVLYLKAKIEDNAGTKGFKQSMVFPLRVTDSQLPRLPLVPRFMHFEDPEYNRQLASASGNAATQMRVGDEFFTLRLSCDRKAYNPDSEMAFRFDWVEGGRPDAAHKVELSYKLISQGSGGVKTLKKEEAVISPSSVPRDGLLISKSLTVLSDDAGRLFAPGDTLQLELKVKATLTNQPAFQNEAGQVVLNLDIVAEPVIPSTRSAYALLRKQGAEGPVDCPRFAWGPNATRIEMINPDDLLQEVVRRRAVFQWTDTVRLKPDTMVKYQLQKISPNGSTHFPEF